MNRPLKKLICVIASAALLFGTAVPALALSPDDNLFDKSNLLPEQASKSSQALTKIYANSGLVANDYFPEIFDLREDYPLNSETKFNPITPVKSQSPWGSCWAFSAIAAAESNINHKTGSLTDLSEMQLAVFNYSHMTRNQNASQTGEGKWLDYKYPLDLGGFNTDAMWLFSIGVGPVTEEKIPYRGIKNDIISFDPNADWSLPDISKLQRDYNLAEVRILPATACYDDEENYYLNQDGVNAIKKELLNGNAVNTFYFADNYHPSKQGRTPHFINTDKDKYAHYTWKENIGLNHAVTIVGWDDSYSKYNFLAVSTDPKTNETVTDIQPPDDGAWIVKNSWGRNDAANANDRYDWGTGGTGYFYLSYYDTSMTVCNVVYDFNVDVSTKDETINQYDTNAAILEYFDFYPDYDASKAANVFHTETPCEISALSTMTYEPFVKVTYSVYLNDGSGSAPDSGTLLKKVTKTYANTGFHKEFLDESLPIPAGATYSVVTEMKSQPSDGILVTSPLYYGPKYFGELGHSSVAVINKGESFFYSPTGNEWIDLTSISNAVQVETGQEYIMDNFAIKTYTTPCSHKETVVRNAVSPTFAITGNSGDIYCNNCGALVENGKAIPSRLQSGISQINQVFPFNSLYRIFSLISSHIEKTPAQVTWEAALNNYLNNMNKA